MTDFDQIKKDYSMPDIASKAGVTLVRNGSEWHGCCPFHSEKTPSFQIYQSPRGWHYHCKGCNVYGDNTDLVEELYGVETNEAIAIITGVAPGRAPIERTEFADVRDPYVGYAVIRPPAGIDPIRPGRRTPPILNPKRVDKVTGKPKVWIAEPTEVYPYRSKDGSLLGYVIRVEFNGKKITPGVWWTKSEDYEGWCLGPMPEPRPLYGRELLSANPNKQVLLVEGEKCVDRANAALGNLVAAVTWNGGANSIHKAQWSTLAGRSVLIWPDNDDPGVNATFGWLDQSKPGRPIWHKGIIEYLFEAKADKVKVVHITRSERDEGWDIADAVDGTKERGFKDKLDADTIKMLIKSQVREWSKAKFEDWKRQQMEPEPDPEPEAPTPALTEEPEPERHDREINDHTWRNYMIFNKDGSAIKSTSLQNIGLLLQYEPRFSGIFAWNDFAKEVTIMRRPPWEVTTRPRSLSANAAAHWSQRLIKDTDVTSAAGWLEYCGLTPRRNDVGAVITRVAEHNRFNPVIEGLDALEWDGQPRINGKPGAPWLTYYLGAEDTEINRKFGEKWLIGAIARAYQPGCKMDNMIILEGSQGLQKSSALKALSDAVAPGVFTDEISDPGSKDAGLQMQGSWIVEIAELDAFRSAEVTTLKAWLARTEDRFRRPYGKIVETFPRSCVMAGTVNPSGIGYLKDPTGGRRFWPVLCSAISLEALKHDAAQLWAEAKHLYQHGTPWWFTKEEEGEANETQRARSEEDPWDSLIDIFLGNMTVITVRQIMDHLDIAKKDRSSKDDRRIKHHLHKAGWIDNGDRTYSRKPEERLL